jgi:2',3'-cyclic-nucleotide 2'-phosphodiesterase (5'-nucleotidase family)
MATTATTASYSSSPNLPFDDINLVVLTDVHSWVGGHPNEPSLDVSYGDVVSFYQHIQNFCQESDRDVWLVQNGDWIDGTGLAFDGDPSHLVPLIQKMPFDILNTGNHELYRDEVVDYMKRPGGFIDWWGDRYLASNVYTSDNHGNRADPLGNQYTVLNGKHSKVLVFGFIFDLPNPSKKVIVQHVQNAVQEHWFHKALTETKHYNAIVVMIHAGHDDPAVTAIHHAIRTILQDDDMPIQFIAGHTHWRRYAVLDPQATVVEAGRYLDTIGWVSFANKESVQRRRWKQRSLQDQDDNVTEPENSSATLFPTDPAVTLTTQAPIDAPVMSVDDSFQHVFLDANIETLENTLGISSSKFDTTSGMDLKNFIDETRRKMGLSNKIGCAPRDYILNASMTHDNSLWRLFADEVVPRELVKDSVVHRVMFLGQGSWRYDLVGRNELTYDDIIAVSPFNLPLYLVAKLSGNAVLQLNATMNDNASEEDQYFSPLPAWILAGHIEVDEECELYSDLYSYSHFKDTLKQLYPDLGEPIPQNLTSTSIWLSFVVNSWHCFGGVFDNQWWSQLDHQVQSSGTSKMTEAIILCVAAIMLCCAFVFVGYICRPICSGVIRIPDRKDYGEMMTSFDNVDDDGYENRNGSHFDDNDEIDYDGDNEDNDDEHKDTPIRIV